MVTVPNVVGQTIENAKTTVIAAGLTAGEASQYSHGAYGIVQFQDPAAGSSVATGTPVDVTGNFSDGQAVIWGS